MTDGYVTVKVYRHIIRRVSDYEYERILIGMHQCGPEEYKFIRLKCGRGTVITQEQKNWFMCKLGEPGLSEYDRRCIEGFLGIEGGYVPNETPEQFIKQHPLRLEEKARHDDH